MLQTVTDSEHNLCREELYHHIPTADRHDDVLHEGQTSVIECLIVPAPVIHQHRHGVRQPPNNDLLQLRTWVSCCQRNPSALLPIALPASPFVRVVKQRQVTMVTSRFQYQLIFLLWEIVVNRNL